MFVPHTSKKNPESTLYNTEYFVLKSISKEKNIQERKLVVKIVMPNVVCALKAGYKEENI